MKLARGDRETLAELAVEMAREKWAEDRRNPEWIANAEKRMAKQARLIAQKVPKHVKDGMDARQRFHGKPGMVIDEQPPGEIDRSIRYLDGTVYRCSELGMFDREWEKLRGKNA